MTPQAMQSLFVRLILDVVAWADGFGFDLTFMALDPSGLAMTLGLFKDGEPVALVEDYRLLGMLAAVVSGSGLSARVTAVSFGIHVSLERTNPNG